MLSSVKDIFTNVDHKTRFNKFKGINIIEYILWPQNEIKLDINNKISKIIPNTWQLYTFLSNPYVKEITKQINYFKLSNKNTTYQNLWNTVLTEKSIVLNVHIRKQEMSMKHLGGSVS